MSGSSLEEGNPIELEVRCSQCSWMEYGPEIIQIGKLALSS